MPDAADIHMHKIGSCVVSNTAAVKRQRRIPQIGGFDSRQTDINRHGLHVQAVASDAGTMGPQEFVAPGRAIAADYVDLGVGFAQYGGEIVQQVENPGIVMADVSGTVVAQVAIEAIKCFGEVMAALAIDDV